MSSVVIAGDTSGSITVSAPAVAGSNTLTLPAATGTVIYSNGSGNLLANSGYGSVSTGYLCRAWVNFNGTGTVAIRASGNVTSITDSGTGQYIVNFTNSMPDTNYCAVVNTRRSDGAGTADPNVGCSVKSGTTYPLSTSACPIVTGSANDGVARDFDYCAVAILR